MVWIITTSERKQFKLLSNDKQRAHFVVNFWERRNPTPGSKENPFKQEHYRRIAFANEHFAAGVAGWRSDRGRIYIVYGPPDSVSKKPQEEGNFPEEVWMYVHMPGGGENVSLRFVDDCFCGAYGLVTNLPNSRWRNDLPAICDCSEKPVGDKSPYRVLMPEKAKERRKVATACCQQLTAMLLEKFRYVVQVGNIRLITQLPFRRLSR